MRELSLDAIRAAACNKVDEWVEIGDPEPPPEGYEGIRYAESEPSEAEDLAYANDPSGYERLTETERAALSAWIAATLKPSSGRTKSSYSLKHYFEKSSEGFYVYNGQFKGAMHAAGYEGEDDGINEHYKLSLPRQKLDPAVV